MIRTQAFDGKSKVGKTNLTFLKGSGRLVLSKEILVGLVACLLSFAFGTLAGYCGTEVSRYTDMHGGAVTPLIVPWAKLLFGFGVTLALCLLASLLPAISVGRTEPLQLLQSGRAAG